MPRSLLAFAVLSTVLLAAGIAGAAAPTDRKGGATAHAYAVKVVVPGQAGGSVPSPALAAPEDAVAFGESFAYPADGSIVTTGALTASVSASAGTSSTASGASDLATLSLFNGEVTADAVAARAKATAEATTASSDLSGTALTNLVVLGVPVPSPAPNQRVALADWGYALLIEQSTAPSAAPAQGYHGFVTALDVHLTLDHGGLPAGSEILVGYADASAEAAKQTAPPLQPLPPGDAVPALPSPPQTSAPSTVAPAPKPKPPSLDTGTAPAIPPVRKAIPAVTPKLTSGGYVFPVYGPSSFIDTFGAARADVNWHHGDDIFAVLGAPLLAVADGTVFSVGWNDVGGNRLWLRDKQGNEFYYAHLSAFSPLAVNGAVVHAGDVVGFLGDSGDARGTPPHVHFEIHPVALLGLGYDGAVDPTSYLQAWQHRQDISFAGASGWAPHASRTNSAPQPGAILLQVSDISNASGLEPESLRRAMLPLASEGDGALVGGLAGLPAAARTAGKPGAKG